MSEVELYPGRVSPPGLGTIAHDDTLEYTGLELLQRIIDNKYPAPPISFQLSFDLTEVSEGGAVFRGLPNERYLNPPGGVHGGWAATAGFGSCLRGANAARQGRGLYDGGVQREPDTADHAEDRRGGSEGRAVHNGRTLAVSEATLKDANGKLLAFGIETCSILTSAKLATR